MYRLVRKILFLIQPERIHDLIMALLGILRNVPFAGALIRALFCYRKPELKKEVFGLTFKNPVGLAAGFDKNGDRYNDLANFGFGFIEIGSLTPEAQPGNPQPRCFRLVKDEAIINHMGINNLGVRHAIEELRRNKPDCILGCSISKGAKTPFKDAAKDYVRCLEFIYDFVDYITINVSCPNVKDVTKLQDSGNLSEIIDKMLELRLMYDDYRPILIKVSPDLTKEQLDEVIELTLISGLDGIIATNTTRDRSNLLTDQATLDKIGEGGLSGKPLFEKSLSTVRYIAEKTKGNFPIIASGGIMTPEQAKQMLDAGASLIQVYSGFIYNGPSFAKKICKYLYKSKKQASASK
ncbi:MAG: quinone-dependent dihydroorotate dehydrogenase [Candidatus Egerieousia sp.]